MEESRNLKKPCHLSGLFNHGNGDMMPSRMTPPAASADYDLVNACLSGNREAFGQIVTRHQALVCSLAYSATGSLTQSEDLAQETFVAAWKHLAELREPAKLRSWLCGIARNLIHNSLRRQEREPAHRAAALEEIDEPRSPEPSPGERAISREEAEILWRALERIPETYREPLVLFYREHQSVQAVAQELELTEDAVRQRLARGRKLLQEEVLAFVEGALQKTAPGTAFTVAVVAALPLAVTSAKAATIGAVAAKGGAGAKSAFSLAALGSLAAMLGAMLFSWKNAVDETKSPTARRLMVRTGWFQIPLFVLSIGAACYGLPRLHQHPLAFGIGLALLLFANVVSGVVLILYVLRRHMEIVMEEGTLFDAEWSGPGKETDRKALRKTVKMMSPILLMFVVGSLMMPWKQHWIRSAVVAAVEGWVIVWAFRRHQKVLSFQVIPGLKSSWVPAVLRHPIISLPAILFGTAVLAVGLVLFINPAGAEAAIHHSPFLRNMGLSLLAAMVAYAIFAVILVKKCGISLGAESAVDKTDGPFAGPPGANMVSRMMGNPVLNKMLALTARMMAPTMGKGMMDMMGKMMVKFYAPVFGQLNLGQDQRAQLEELIMKKNAVNMDKGLALMKGSRDAARRAVLIEDMKSGREGCDAEIRRILGDENYPVFEQFEKSIPDRIVLGLFKSKSARSRAALSEEQQEQLLQAVSAARAQYPWSTDLSLRIQNPADPVAMFSPENIATFAREEEEFDRRLPARVEMILTAEQLAAFEPFLAKQRQGKIASMKMTAKMFAPGGS
jgi:RNA polymerase sigma factor (sigma-70 family)